MGVLSQGGGSLCGVEIDTVADLCRDWPERGTTWAKFWRRGGQEPDGSGADLTSEVKGQLLVHFRRWSERSQGTDCVFA